MQLGKWQLDTVDGGSFWIDGGVMFGVVPKSLWQAVAAADGQNRVPCANHCVLARDGRRTILIDTGYGGKLSPLDRKFYRMDPGEPLLASLAGLGLSPLDIDLVVFSHLHFDHAGGATRREADGRLVPTFPRARYLVAQAEWEDALLGAPELQTAYTADNLLPLRDARVVELLDADAPIVPGLRACTTGGHTRGHVALIFESAGQGAVYPSDVCPTTHHLRRMWHTAYDLYPVETRRRKPLLLGEAADRGWHILWNHDPQYAVSRIERHAKREFVAVDGKARL